MVAESQPGHIDHIKQINAGTVYRLIDRFGPISRIDLSKKSQLAPASITKIVREMLDVHLVKETEYQEPGSRGRPAVGLVLDTEAWHFLAVRIGQGDITLTLRDLSGKKVVEQQEALPAEAEEPLLQRIIQQIDQFFATWQAHLERLTAIAITLPGRIDSQKGIVHSMPFYSIQNMPLGPELASKTGLPVYVQHEICAWTMAESLFGVARDTRDVIQVMIDHNVGAGVITGGQLLHSGSATLVEIGHTRIDPLGKRCYCGHQGCLETVASTDNLLAQAEQQLPAFPHSVLHCQPLTIETLCDAALAGDPLAGNIITEVGTNIGRILAIMVNLFNPGKIVIGSPLNRASTLLFPAINNCIQQQSLPDYGASLTIESARFINQGTIPGVALIKDALYNGSLLLKLLLG